MGTAVELYKKHEDGTMEPCGIFYCSQCRIVHEPKKRLNGAMVSDCVPAERKSHGVTFSANVTNASIRNGKKKSARKKRRVSRPLQRSRNLSTLAITSIAEISTYDSVEDAIDQYLVGQEPEYVWACRTHGIPTVDVEDVTTNILDNMWDEADINDLNGVEELEEALKAFNKANESIQLWEPDYTTAILVEKRDNGEEQGQTKSDE